jgi:hypothetical protein
MVYRLQFNTVQLSFDALGLSLNESAKSWRSLSGIVERNGELT